MAAGMIAMPLVMALRIQGRNLAATTSPQMLILKC